MHQLLGILSAVALMTAACVPGAPGGGGQAAAVPAKNVEPANKLAFWHAMSGINGDAVNRIVDGFNKSQNKIQVEAIFQGSYDDSLAKLKAALPTNSAPALIQVYDIGQRFMIDSGEIVPMQDFIDRDSFDTSDFETAVLNYYKVQDRLYSMPFNASSAILYYNKDAFKEAGLDPGNGRDGRATRVVYNDDKGKSIVDWWKQGVDGGWFFNPGQAPTGNDLAAQSFDAGKVAMYVESTARLRGHITTAQGKFEVGTGFYPRPNSAPADGGNIIGGASVYILKSRPAAEQQAAWEFVKYVSSPAVQSQWQSDTGYYAIRKAAYNEAPSKEWAGKYPQFLTAVDEIRQAPANRMTQGAVIGVFPEARARVQKAIESVLLGQETSSQALNAAAEEITASIDKYNKSTGKS